MSEYQIIIYGAATLLALLLFVMLMLKSVKFRKLELQQAQKDVLLTENEKYINELKERCSIFAAENSQLLAENTKLKSDNENQKKYMEYKLADLEKSKDEMSERFKNVSNEVIQTQHRRFNEEQKNILNLMLEPFKQQIADFKTKVESAHEESLKNKSSFDEQFKNLLDLNQTLSKDAENLSAALKGNKKIQGNWGEFQLERILEISGLQKGINYVTQETFRNDDNQMLRPDVIIKLPNDRNVIVDSKVSLNDYVNYVNCDDEQMRQVYLQRHIQCVKKHIDELAGKDYQKLIKNNMLDYVVIFIPVESAYVEAVRADNSLYDYAYKKNIAITTPSSLLPILRTIENLWQIESQNRNVAEIANIGGSLYDKIVGFVEDMQHIDKSIETARKNYDLAMKKLSTGKGNALSLAGKLKEKGAKVTKNLAISYEDTELPQITEEVDNE
ncbi:MAG: DNA recombination protein RmuC [Alphaproteobacteria bacterium]|mgnify:FL=1|nr:DNA recombination protein RmuC [Alphaproteobacteria bacterium]